jgi:hypothetical protein
LQPVLTARKHSIVVVKKMCSCPKISDHPATVEIVFRR